MRRTKKCPKCSEVMPITKDLDSEPELICPNCQEKVINPNYASYVKMTQIENQNKQRTQTMRLLAVFGVIAIVLYVFSSNSSNQTKNSSSGGVIDLREQNFHDKCVNPLYGTCTGLVDYVKENMNDAESFEHLDSKVWYSDDYATVLMKYREKNAFGAKVLSSIKAKVSYNCRVLEVIETYP